MLYGAYGSNLNLKQMQKRCPQSKVMGVAKLSGWCLAFCGTVKESYLTLVPNPLGQVELGIFEVNESDILRLDNYEGFPNYYHKKAFQLEVNGKIADVFVYIMNDGFTTHPPQAWYLKACEQGFLDFGFDLNKLHHALSIAKESQS